MVSSSTGTRRAIRWSGLRHLVFPVADQEIRPELNAIPVGSPRPILSYYSALRFKYVLQCGRKLPTAPTPGRKLPAHAIFGLPWTARTVDLRTEWLGRAPERAIVELLEES